MSECYEKLLDIVWKLSYDWYQGIDEVSTMDRNIQQIMELFLHDPFWAIGKVKTPDKARLQQFAASYRLPEDYIKLLSITDGFVLFGAGDYRIDDIGFVLEWHEPRTDAGFVEQVLEIGYFMDYALLINQNESQTSSYLYAGDACSLTEFIRIGTITDFFNGLIASKGEIPFWNTEGQELFDFSEDHLSVNPGILEVPARGRTVISRRPYYPTEEEIRVNGSTKAVIVTYSNGIEEKFFLRNEDGFGADVE